MAHTPKTHEPFWKRIHLGTRHFSEPLTLGRIWLYMLLGAIVLGVGLFLWSTYLFLGVNKESLFVPTEEEQQTVLTIDRSRLEEVLTFTESRRVHFNTMHQVTLPIPEPR